jgi:hypothetical protein
MVRSAKTHDGFQLKRARQVQGSVQAAVACPLCPEVTPERGVEIFATTNVTDLGYTPKITVNTKERTDTLLKDKAWRQPALEWIGAFWAEHEHGPTWSRFLAADGIWPEDFPKYMRRVVMAKLYQRGYLDGTKTPFGLKACAKPCYRPPRQRKPTPIQAEAA